VITKYTVRTKHRSHGFGRWFAACRCGAKSPYGNEADVNRWRDDHAFPVGGQPHAAIEATYQPRHAGGAA
jgi:hypothetical protein